MKVCPAPAGLFLASNCVIVSLPAIQSMKRLDRGEPRVGLTSRFPGAGLVLPTSPARCHKHPMLHPLLPDPDALTDRKREAARWHPERETLELAAAGPAPLHRRAVRRYLPALRAPVASRAGGRPHLIGGRDDNGR